MPFSPLQNRLASLTPKAALPSFRKAVHKHRAISASKDDDRSVPSRLSLPRTRDPLLDDAAPKVCIHPSLFRPCHSVQQRGIPNPFPSGKPLKPLLWRASLLWQNEGVGS
jgi:hypothetical protein